MQKPAISVSPDDLVKVALELGEYMLISGGEISRVEDSISRVCYSYGAQRVDVFSIISEVILTVHMPDGISVTHSRRIYSGSTNLHALEELNALSREICSNTPPLEDIKSDLHRIGLLRPVSQREGLLGSILASGSFTIFFGGSILDGICAAAISIMMYYFKRKVVRPGLNQFAITFAQSVLAGLAAILLTAIGIGQHEGMIMVGNIMLLIPGIAMANSLRDLLCGNLLAGILRLIDALLTAAAIAFGMAFALFTLGGLL